MSKPIVTTWYEATIRSGGMTTTVEAENLEILESRVFGKRLNLAGEKIPLGEVSVYAVKEEKLLLYVTPPKASNGESSGNAVSSVCDNSGQVSPHTNVREAVPPVAGKGKLPSHMRVGTLGKEGKGMMEYCGGCCFEGKMTHGPHAACYDCKDGSKYVPVKGGGVG